MLTSNFSKNQDAMFLVTGFAILSPIADRCQVSCCIKNICCSWVNVCCPGWFLHNYKWSVEILITLSIILYLKIMYPNMGPPTTPGSQVPHHLNPALGPICEVLSTIPYVCVYVSANVWSIK